MNWRKQLKDQLKTNLNSLNCSSKQQELIARLHQENCNIAEVQYSQELQAMFVKMKQYHLKLQSIKKDIRGLHDKSQKLKVVVFVKLSNFDKFVLQKRALKLKEIKEKDPQEEIIITKPTSVISVNSEGVSTSQTG